MLLDDDITVLLERLASGDTSAEEELVPRVYSELRRLAASQLRREGAEVSLQPTGLVHEAYIRMVQQNRRTNWQGRAHFFSVAARLMRNILVDRARVRKAQKRGSGLPPVELQDVAAQVMARPERLIRLDDALNQLAEFAPRQSRIVELRFFGGLSEQEIAEVLGISDRTVKRDWAMAKAWLQGQV